MSRKIPVPFKYEASVKQMFGRDVYAWKHITEEGDSVYRREFTHAHELHYFLEDRYGKRFADSVMKGLKPTEKQNPLFDRYTVKTTDGSISKNNILTLNGAESTAKKFSAKYPCAGIEIVSQKFGSVVKSYKARTGPGPLKVDRDNTHDYKRKEHEAERNAFKFVLYIGGQEYATYDTKAEAEREGKREGKGERVSVKRVAANPRGNYPLTAYFDTHPEAVTFMQQYGGKIVKKTGAGWLVHYGGNSSVRSNPADAIALLDGYEFHESVSPSGAFAITVVHPQTGESYYTENTPDGVVQYGENAGDTLPDAIWDELGVLYARSGASGVEVRENPSRVSGKRITDLGGGFALLTERSGFSGDLLYYPLEQGIAHPDGKPFWHKIYTSAFGTPEYDFRNRASVMRFLNEKKAQSKRNPLTGSPANDIPLLRHEGRPQRQAVAIALSEHRRVQGVSNPVHVATSERDARAIASRTPGAYVLHSGSNWLVLYPMGARRHGRRNSALSDIVYEVGHYFVKRERFGKSDGYGLYRMNATHAVRIGQYGSGDKYLQAAKERANILARGDTRKKNPGNAAAEADAMFETFHGVPSEETIDYHTEEFERIHLATLGDLIQLKVETTTGKYAELNTPDPSTSTLEQVVKLACSPDGSQLYLVGGDQSIPYEKIGFGDKDVRDFMVIGLICEITYRTRKKFDNLEETDYYHETGEETKVKRISDEFRRKPSLIYCPHDCTIKIAGGLYEVKDIGIVN